MSIHIFQPRIVFGICAGSLNDEELRKTRLSMMKVRYLKDLANHTVTGKIDFDALETMDDKTAINTQTFNLEPMHARIFHRC